MSQFDSALEIMKALHTKKQADYSSEGEWDNFELTGHITGLSVEDVFLTQIANKTARIKSLRLKGGEPNNESLQDTRMDLAIYSTMYFAYFLSEE